ncbi:hypothetical protein Ocin01_04271 [Orchesella cincta]|uniref:Uncharacterized protein n=1 Tax=Orchesella cincta TaxID=48709 RepID=A0A1D2NAX9_ORCCI|nr:hypothetical protein Ocin01_04271 [Orchesella cincta]
MSDIGLECLLLKGIMEIVAFLVIFTIFLVASEVYVLMNRPLLQDKERLAAQPATGARQSNSANGRSTSAPQTPRVKSAIPSPNAGSSNRRRGSERGSSTTSREQPLEALVRVPDIDRCLKMQPVVRLIRIDGPLGENFGRPILHAKGNISTLRRSDRPHSSPIRYRDWV